MAIGIVPAVEESLAVDGVLPHELSGVFLQASRHPTGGPGWTLTGIALGGGRAGWYRASDTARAEEFGPVLDLGGGAMVAKPVHDASSGLWHTVATYPGLGFAEHVVTDTDGSILGAEPFPLDGTPLISAVAITGRFLIVLDLPVTYRRAAALMGSELPFAWQENRPARIGLLPLRTKAEPRWFAIDPCYIFDTINAYDDGNRVIFDAVRHAKAFAGKPVRPGHVCRWELDLKFGRARARRLSDPINESIVDGRVTGQRHGLVFSSTVDRWGCARIARHDLNTWRTHERLLGHGLRTGRPVFVPRRGGAEGEGWLLTLVEDLAHREGMLLVLDAMNLDGQPAAIVHIPVVPPPAERTTWYPAAPM
jgi:8'-apo-carotenoid 13,14-cleaving dioxygenase